jgi:hypothetical protein
MTGFLPQEEINNWGSTRQLRQSQKSEKKATRQLSKLEKKFI